VQMRESVSGFILPQQERTGVAASVETARKPEPRKVPVAPMKEEEVFVENDPEADLEMPEQPVSADAKSAGENPDDELLELDQFEAEIEAMLKGER